MAQQPEEARRNQDLWEPFIALVASVVTSTSVGEGHSGDRMNDLVDRLAVEAATTQRVGRRASPASSARPRRVLVGYDGVPPLLRRSRVRAGRAGASADRARGYDDNPLAGAVRGPGRGRGGEGADVRDLVVVGGHGSAPR
jgi:hypothetical protein